MAEKRTRTIGEAARVLGICKRSAYEAARRGEIPTIRIGKRVLVPDDALDHLLDGTARQSAHGRGHGRGE